MTCDKSLWHGELFVFASGIGRPFSEFATDTDGWTARSPDLPVSVVVVRAQHMLDADPPTVILFCFSLVAE